MLQLLNSLALRVFGRLLTKAEHRIGYRLKFRHSPDRFINGYVSWNMTKQFQRAGLGVEAGLNYWTTGRIVGNHSSRFDPNATEYQSWTGGYLVKLFPGQSWDVKQHFRLAIADQNGWLSSYGDPDPTTTTDGYEFTAVDRIVNGRYCGTLYEGRCKTHSDVGSGKTSITLLIHSIAVALLFNMSNPALRLSGRMFIPRGTKQPYETLELHGYIAIFDIEERVKVVLYGNGALLTRRGHTTVDTFEALAKDLLSVMRSCEITPLPVNTCPRGICGINLRKALFGSGKNGQPARTITANYRATNPMGDPAGHAN